MSTISYPNPCKLTIVADIGGTNFRVALLDDEARILGRNTMQTPAKIDPATIMNWTWHMATELLSSQEISYHICALVLGIPGAVNHQLGVVSKSSSFGWEQVPLTEFMQLNRSIPLFVESDVLLHTLGYYAKAPLTLPDDWVYVAIGTGIAMGAVSGGRPVIGSHGMAGELGHITVEMEGRQCGCGKRGCLETICGAKGLRQLWAEETGTLLHDVTSLLPAADSEITSPSATRVWDRFARSLASGLNVVQLLFDPALIVFGGGIGATMPLWETLLKGYLAEYIISGLSLPELIVSQLGDDAPLLGGWMMARQRKRETEYRK